VLEDFCVRWNWIVLAGLPKEEAEGRGVVVAVIGFRVDYVLLRTLFEFVGGWFFILSTLLSADQKYQYRNE
jgi:hypothetical protein